MSITRSTAFDRHLPILLAPLLLVYCLFLGTYAGEQDETLRLLGSVAGLCLLVAWIYVVRRGADATDAVVIGAVLLFLVACLASRYPRQSLDAGTTAMAYAAAFGVGRRAVATEAGRRALLLTLAAIGVAVAIAFGTIWLVAWQAWLTAYDGTRAPALDMNLPGGPFGFRHHVAILCALCAPAMLMLWRTSSPAVRITLGIGMLMTAFVIVAAGSRNVWVAIVVASVVVLVPGVVRSGRLPSVLRWRTGLAVVVIGVAVVGGLILVAGGAVASRLSTFATLITRADLWSASVDAWTASPITGHGPGSFPFVLRETDYFTTNLFAARHPENAVLQLLAEGGMLGIAAVTLLIVGVGRKLLDGWTPAVRSGAWAASFFGTVALAANPSDFGFLIAPVIALVAYACPFPTPRTSGVRTRLPGWAFAGALVPIVAAYALIGGAAAIHEAARADIDAENHARAAERLRQASALDPSMALYRRELGWTLALEGKTVEALSAFDRAIHLNAVDTPAHRGRAVAAMALGQEDVALEAAADAMRISASDPRNQLLAAAVEHAFGGDPRADLLLTVQQEPILAASAAWDDLGVSAPTELLADAAAAYRDGTRTDVAPAEEVTAAFLAFLTNDPALADVAASDDQTNEAETLLLSSLGCPAEDTLTPVTTGEPSAPGSLYWTARLVVERLYGDMDPASVQRARFHQSRLLDIVLKRTPDATLTNDAFLDASGYDHRPIDIASEPLIRLPSPGEAGRRFATEPEAVADLRALAGC